MAKVCTNFDDVAEIVPNQGSTRIKVRVLRLWKIPSFLNPSEISSIEMVLIDEKVSLVFIYCLCCLFGLHMVCSFNVFEDPVSSHMENLGLEFLQFAFRWFNCLLIREIPFQLVTRLWDTYLAEGDALPDFLVYIFASFLLTVSIGKQWKEFLDYNETIGFIFHDDAKKLDRAAKNKYVVWTV
ncbi:eukaryotic translation initiation factor 4E-1 [Trifolium repens]|nr:eukaryotic translation initiation factor 4E-1 [Trifolium repens]